MVHATPFYGGQETLTLIVNKLWRKRDYVINSAALYAAGKLIMMRQLWGFSQVSIRCCCLSSSCSTSLILLHFPLLKSFSASKYVFSSRYSTSRLCSYNANSKSPRLALIKGSLLGQSKLEYASGPTNSP